MGKHLQKSPIKKKGQEPQRSRRRLQKSPIEKEDQEQQRSGRRKPISLPKELYFVAKKEGYKMIAKIPEDVFEKIGSTKIRDHKTKVNYARSLVVDKGTYEVSLHQNRYNVVLKDIHTGEIASFPMPLTRVEFQRQVQKGKIIYSEALPPKKRVRRTVKNVPEEAHISTARSTGETAEEPDEDINEITNIDESPKPEELRKEEEGEASE